MALLIFDGYSPSQDPVSYEVNEEDVLATSVQTENGRKFTERARIATHSIPASYVNLPSEDIANMKAKLDMSEIPMQFFKDGAMLDGFFRLKNGSKKTKLKYKDSQDSYWDLSFELEEV